MPLAAVVAATADRVEVLAGADAMMLAEVSQMGYGTGENRMWEFCG